MRRLGREGRWGRERALGSGAGVGSGRAALGGIAGAGVGIGLADTNAASTRWGGRGIRATLWDSGQLWPPDSFSRRAARASSEASVPVAPAPGVEVEVTAPGVPP